MEDVQSRPDDRGIRIDRAGVSDLRYPIVVLDREQGKQQTIGTFSVSAAVPAVEKGTHMSRFVEVLNDHVGELTMHTFPQVLRDLRERLATESVALRVEFPYFLARSAPATGATGLMDYDCWFVAESAGETETFRIGVIVPVTSLCPCSKAISDYGRHNQRGRITMEVTPRRSAAGEFDLVWIEELIAIGEESGSAPVYPLLKRTDERHVTMQAYDNPVFVEDMVRSVALRLEADQRVASYRVHAANHESIHNHDAFAEIRSQQLPD